MISVGIDLGQTCPSIKFISGRVKSMFLMDGSVEWDVTKVAEIVFSGARVGYDGVDADCEPGDAVRVVRHKSPDGYEVKGLVLGDS